MPFNARWENIKEWNVLSNVCMVIDMVDFVVNIHPHLFLTCILAMQKMDSKTKHFKSSLAARMLDVKWVQWIGSTLDLDVGMS